MDTIPKTSRRTPAAMPRRWLLVAGLVLVALNLRPALTSVSPVLADIRATLGLSATGAGLLTTLPVLCLGLFAPLAGWLARRCRCRARGLRRAVRARDRHRVGRHRWAVRRHAVRGCIDRRHREFCGATFDPKGRVLFVNIQTPGITFAIWGPFRRGLL
jgi:hypothetical protein